MKIQIKLKGISLLCEKAANGFGALGGRFLGLGSGRRGSLLTMHGHKESVTNVLLVKMKSRNT